jgi:hypothetical protein
LNVVKGFKGYGKRIERRGLELKEDIFRDGFR